MKHMVWNSDKLAYFGETSEGKHIRVEAGEMAESAQEAGVDVGELSGISTFIRDFDEQVNGAERELLDADAWAMCLGANQNVSIVE